MMEIHGARRGTRAAPVVFQVAVEDNRVLIKRRDEREWVGMTHDVARELAAFLNKGADEVTPSPK